MFHYTSIGCDYHCSITVEKKSGEYTVNKNGCPTGAMFATNEFKKMENKNTLSSKGSRKKTK